MIAYKKIIAFAPLISLILVTVFNFFNIFFDAEKYDTFFINSAFVMSNFFGFSVITTLVYWFMAQRHNFCLYSKIAILGLFFQNIMNILDGWLDLSYNLFFQGVLILGLSFFVFVSLIFLRHNA